MTQKKGKALVVGAGISGMRAAIDLAECGYAVILIDQKARLGGVSGGLDRQFPSDGCGMCRMIPHSDPEHAIQQCMKKGLSHENISVMLQTGVASVEGEAGSFRVALLQHPNPVDQECCTGCGLCIPTCPVEMPDLFNAGTKTKKAIGPPSPYTPRGPYYIDTEACTRCGACIEVCPTGAISMPDEDRSSFTVLVVDDEQIIRDSLREWLGEEGGFSVVTAKSGQEALELIRDRQVDLMLADIKMPGMDGIELLDSALQINPDLAVMMITAYATVDTAVEAMKLGAVDYLVKPFDPDSLLPKIAGMFYELTLPPGPETEVGAIILACGTGEYDPAEGKNPFGYKVLADVVTGIEFERILSPAGPNEGRLERPSDGRGVTRIAWVLCVGSRDIQENADFCSGVCCMYALKQARMVKKAAKAKGAKVDCVIYYMDMRTFAKNYQQYKDDAEAEGVRCVRSRVHSITMDAETGDLCIRGADQSGMIRNDCYDMAVLATGQRPAAQTDELAEMLGLEKNPWGFVAPRDFSETMTSTEGVLAAGSVTGRKDISDSVISGSSAALGASRILHRAGGGLREISEQTDSAQDISRDPPEIFAAVCTCGNALSGIAYSNLVSGESLFDPSVCSLQTADQLCTKEGLEALVEKIRQTDANRAVIGACGPLCTPGKKKAIADAAGLHPGFLEITDITRQVPAETWTKDSPLPHAHKELIKTSMEMAIEEVKYADPEFSPRISVTGTALVVGGGIAGMTAALGIADHGYEVWLAEKQDRLGGNLNWISSTIEGLAPEQLLEHTRSRVENHGRINVCTETQVISTLGWAGAFTSTLESSDGNVFAVNHGAAVLATGGTEAGISAFGHGTDPRIITQKDFETRMGSGDFEPEKINSLCMILCAETRQEPRNYCSRVCCESALKHALQVKEKNPDANVYIFYRDIMACGFLESFYTKARSAGVIFIAYEPQQPPQVSAEKQAVRVSGHEPVLGRELEIESDLLVLAAGIVPELPSDLAANLGAEKDQHGFFMEAEYKWLPVHCAAKGVFACGLALRPGNITGSIASAEAAAFQAVCLLAQNRMPAARSMARVRHSLCSLCMRCVVACPFGARIHDKETNRILINPAACTGCGACATVCPNFASYVQDFSPKKMLSAVDAAADTGGKAQ
ncbi:MAG: response regulator [Thermodesulfobacteriota bacterium]